MEEIEHKYVQVNGLKLHVAEIGKIGSSPAVVFLHGFPEIWYSWRHQMTAVARAVQSYRTRLQRVRVIDPPPEPEKTTFMDLLADILALLDDLGLSKVILIGKDFGSRIAYIFSLLHPGRVSGVITLGVPFVPPSRPTVLKHLPEGSYISRWQERGRAETDFSRFDCKTVIRNIYILFSRNEVPIANENQEIMDILDVSTPLPSWSLHEEFNIANLKVEVPALVIMGGKDYSLKFPGIEDHIKSGRAKVYVPNLETAFLLEGSHFMQEQFPDQVNQLVLNFLSNYS
ncbi:hypothetical protein BUALT_Bualt03G0062000 [Buddleja alternifolia]|uniref:AB hydrolase-1 domain-containing protein n=1 Tax=Buddleja alternifolia TaxID=168488 RepID=A0AAV6Y2B3_9LAMI|nr:hypothetical protein BUALT_Bualt03G0062000 [Buddleja alternifolia]